MNKKEIDKKMPKKRCENPFNTSKPVKNREDFFGREEELENVLDLLFKSESEDIQCISIVGERRIGKTSFINILLNETTLRSFGIDINNYILIYMNVAEKMAKSQENILTSILNELLKKESLDISLYENKNNIFDKFIEIVDKIRCERKKKIILVLDEIEAIYHIWDTTFSGWLRTLSEKHRVGFVTVTLKPLNETCETKGETLLSPFHNIFQAYTLGLLDENSSKIMIREMFSKGGIELDNDEIEFLYKIAGRNPFFIQLFGSLYFQKRRKREKNQIDPNLFKKEAFEQGKAHFKHYWKNFDEREREYLVRLKDGSPNSDSFIEFDLERRGLLIKKGGKTFFFSPLFGEFVQEIVKETRISPGQKLENLLDRIQKNRRNIYILLFFIFLGCGISFIWLGSQLIVGALASIVGAIILFLIVRLIKPKNH